MHDPRIFVNPIHDPEFGSRSDLEQIGTVWGTGDEKETPRMRHGREPRLENMTQPQPLFLPQSDRVTAAVTRQIVKVALCGIRNIEGGVRSVDVTSADCQRTLFEFFPVERLCPPGGYIGFGLLQGGDEFAAFPFAENRHLDHRQHGYHHGLEIRLTS
jgi:hypothetical protein